nr:hypothetical protein [Tanacetum cinerariifolium]
QATFRHYLVALLQQARLGFHVAVVGGRAHHRHGHDAVLIGAALLDDVILILAENHGLRIHRELLARVGVRLVQAHGAKHVGLEQAVGVG